jgi:hypothetical protein
VHCCGPLTPIFPSVDTLAVKPFTGELNVSEPHGETAGDRLPDVAGAPDVLRTQMQVHVYETSGSNTPQQSACVGGALKQNSI